MQVLRHLFENNRAWARRMTAMDPEFFSKLSHQQAPQYLWIGCSDSRVPANEIVGLAPGELFVHRNVANLVVHTDLNCLSVIQYAVDALGVAHIIVCGHYGCGGIRAAIGESRLGLIDNWILHIKDLARQHQETLSGLRSATQRANRLCELNVVAQVANVCHTTIVRHAWDRGQELAVHGWIYGIEDGLLKDLGVCVTNPQEAAGLV